MRDFIFKRILPRLYYIYFGISIVSKEILLTDSDKCLCLAPHPDDESIGCGGIMSLHPENFKVVCLTDGSRAGSPLTKEELIQKRKEEFQKAMDIAGVKSHEMIEIPDRKLVLDTDIYEQIDISDYDYIFMPNFLDQHRDHKATSVVLKNLLKKPHKKGVKIVFYEVWSTLMLPNAFVDISSVIDKKKQMVDAHASQVEGIAYTEKIAALNSFRGLAVGRNYAEAFQVVDVPTFKKILKAATF